MNTQIVKDSWKFAWEGFKKNMKFFLILAVVLAVIFGGLDMLSGEVPLAGLVSTILGVLVSIGFISISEAVYTNNKPTKEMFWIHRNKFWKMLGASILAGVIMMAPIFIGFVVSLLVGYSVIETILNGYSLLNAGPILILLLASIIVTVYFLIKLSFYKYMVYENTQGVIDSIKKSWKMTNGKVGLILLFGISAFGVNLIGLICFVIGLAVTIPMTVLATYFLYKNIAKGSNANVETEAMPETIPAPTSTPV